MKNTMGLYGVQRLITGQNIQFPMSQKGGSLHYDFNNNQIQIEDDLYIDRLKAFHIGCTINNKEMCLPPTLYLTT